MNPTITRAAASIATASLMMVAPLTAPVFAAPVVVDTLNVIRQWFVFSGVQPQRQNSLCRKLRNRLRGRDQRRNR